MPLHVKPNSLSRWPDIPYPPWRETCAALHLYAQIVGKYRLARTPWVNHSWHATLYVGARGLSTSIVPDGPGGIEVSFDLLGHAVIAAAADGRSGRFALAPMSVAEFHARFLALIGGLGGTPVFDGRPNEIPDPVPFTEDQRERPYDADAVTRFFQALVEVDRVMKRFRTSYLGRVNATGASRFPTCTATRRKCYSARSRGAAGNRPLWKAFKVQSSARCWSPAGRSGRRACHDSLR